MNPDQAKFLVDYFATVWEGEVPGTVKVLANVLDDKRTYQPDAKSRTAWELATHVALGDLWFLQSIIDGNFKFDAEGEKTAAAKFASTKEVAAFYGQQIPAKLKELRALPVDRLTREVDFFGMMKQPAVAYLGLANNHGIHHRGQLAAYLRAMGSKVPALYGGSADEPTGGS